MARFRPNAWIGVNLYGHDELHVRMEEQGQNLAPVATDIDVDPRTLIDVLVESWSPAIDSRLEQEVIASTEADHYRAALEEAFTFRVTWDGSEATPNFATRRRRQCSTRGASPRREPDTRP